MDIQGKRVLITGGPSGIGFATAAEMMRRGAKVFIVGRRAKLVAFAIELLRADGYQIDGVDADVSTSEGRARILASARAAMGGIDILVNNAGGVSAGRLEDTPKSHIEKMVDVNLLAPILLVRAAMQDLRDAGESMVVNVSSSIALVGVPFYSTYAAVKAGISHFGEALRRELKDEGVHVMTVYPGATDTPMMMSSRVGPALGFERESAEAVAQAIAEGIETDSLQIIRGGKIRDEMIVQNRTNPRALDDKFASLKPQLAEAVKDHFAL